MENNTPQSPIVTTKDIQRILGKGDRSARDFMHKLRAYFNKRPGQYVSVSEFCEFVGLKKADVKDFF